MNKVDTCHDVQQKKRGRPKLRDKEAQQMATSSTTITTAPVKLVHISLGSKSNFSMTRPAQSSSEAGQKTTVITVSLSIEFYFLDFTP
jgi:hypothetical protein